MSAIRAEVKNLFLIETEQGNSYNSCLAVTGKELVQASLINMQNEIWSHNYVDTITQAYLKMASNKTYQVDVDRVDYCACHM